MSSSTTSVTVISLNRNFFSIEVCPNYFDIESKNQKDSKRNVFIVIQKKELASFDIITYAIIGIKLSNFLFVRHIMH